MEAARLAKADLATSLVTEMTALAGTMGQHYALKQGIKPSVAEARPFAQPHVAHLWRGTSETLLTPSWHTAARELYS